MRRPFGEFLCFSRSVPQSSRSFPTPFENSVTDHHVAWRHVLADKTSAPQPGVNERQDRSPSTGLTPAQICLTLTSVLWEQDSRRPVRGSGKYISVNRMEFTTDDRNHIRVLLIIDDDRAVAHTFRLPRSGDAVYRQSHGQWSEVRVQSKGSDISIAVRSYDGRVVRPAKLKALVVHRCPRILRPTSDRR